MGSNSQFRELAKRVDKLETAIGKPDTEAELRKQKEFEKLAKDYQRAQQQAKSVLLNDDATTEELENAIPMLDSVGLQEFARLEVRKRRDAADLQRQLQEPLIKDTRLMENMIAAANDGSYQQLQATLPKPRYVLNPLPIEPAEEDKMQAMRVARDFYAARNQDRLDRAEPLKIDSSDELNPDYYMPKPNTINGVVVTY